MNRRLDYQLDLPLFVEPECASKPECHSRLSPQDIFTESVVSTPRRTQNAKCSSVTNLRTPAAGYDRAAEYVSQQVSSCQILADVPLSAQLLLSFEGVDNSVQVGQERSWLLSEELPAQRAFALPSREETLESSTSGTCQKQLAGDMSVLSPKGT